MPIDPNQVSTVSIAELLPALSASEVNTNTFLIAVYNPTLTSNRKTQQMTIAQFLQLVPNPIWGNIDGTLSNQTDLQTALNGKANLSHNHAIGDVAGLQTALDGKADSVHNHAIGDVTGLQTALDSKANLNHNHAIGDVTGLQTALDGKANLSHNHTASNITDFSSAVASLISASGSINLDSLNFSLVGDAVSPGNNKYYGTNSSGNKGFFDLPTGGSGEANTASNLGSGEGVFASKVGVDLRFKSLIGSSKIILSSDANEISFALAALTPGDIPNLDASKITTGTFTDDRIPASIARDSEVVSAVETHEASRNHPVATTSQNGFLSSSDKTKLDGIEPGATANSTDAQLRDRSTHTGTQSISTISGLQTELDNKQPLDSDLTAIAALSTTAFGRGLLTETNAASLRSTAGLVIGTDVQAHSARLSDIVSGFSAAANGSVIRKSDSGSSLEYVPVGVAAYVGEIRWFARSSIPTGWLECDGSAVSRTTYATLFGIIGTTWGAGNGSTTFNLPDFRGRSIISKSPGSLGSDRPTARSLGQTGGSETATVEAHTHTYNAPGTTTGVVQSGSGATGIWAAGPVVVNTGSTGSGSSHNNMPPFAVIVACICYDSSLAAGGGGGGSGITRSVNVISSSTTAGSTALTDYVYLVSGTTTLTLPTAVGNTNRYTVKRIGTNTVTINTTSGQTIDGSTSIQLTVQYLSVDLISDDSNWHVI